MKKRIIFATSNQHKMQEVRQILEGLDVEILSQKEAGLSADADENGTTFEENALIKARAISAICSDIVLADDSGLEVDYINKEPGVYSSRYMGEDTSYVVKNQNIIDRLANAKGSERSARFVCVIAAVFPDGTELTARATIEGVIGYEAKGENGFGYDPIFFLEEGGKSTAELSAEEKNAISHRGKALRIMREELVKRL